MLSAIADNRCLPAKMQHARRRRAAKLAALEIQKPDPDPEALEICLPWSAHGITDEKTQKPEDAVRITLLQDRDKSRVDGEVRPEDVLVWLQSKISKEMNVSEEIVFG